MVSTRASSSDQRKWQEAFHGLLQLLKNQQTHIHSLANEKKFLEDRLELFSSRWKSDVKLLTDQINQERREAAVQEMSRRVDSSKAELFLGMKQTEAVIYKTKLDKVLDELSDFRSLYNNSLKSHQSSNNNGHNDNVLALLSEKDFALDQLKKKGSEIENANSKIKRLESINGDKDDLILQVKADFGKFDSIKKKKSADVSSTCRPRTRSFSAAAAASRRMINKEDNSTVSQFTNLGGRSLKRSRE